MFKLYNPLSSKRQKLTKNSFSNEQQEAIFVSLDQEQQSIYKGLTAEQRQAHENADNVQRIYYMAILELQHNNKAENQLSPKAKNILQCSYADITDKAQLRVFLGSNYSYLSLLVDAPIVTPTDADLSAALKAKKATVAESNPVISSARRLSF